MRGGLSRLVCRAFASVFVGSQHVVDPERSMSVVVLGAALDGDADGKQRRRGDQEHGENDAKGLGGQGSLPNISSMMGCAAAGPATSSSTESPTRRPPRRTNP